MCILLVTTAHPEYPLILLNNRDEFLHRPTQSASFWEPPHSHVLSGRDLARPERGTWLGVTRSGRIAVLTNFREASTAAAFGVKSRGAMVTSFLTSTESSTPTKQWIHQLLEDGEMKGVGGFSLFCGILRKGEEGGLQDFAVISNRTAKGENGVEEGAHWILGRRGETHGLSNSLFENPWPKITLGRELLEKTVKEVVDEGSDEKVLLEKLFAVLSHDTLPVTDGIHTYERDLESLRHSIFIPAFKASEENPTASTGTPEPAAEAESLETPPDKHLPEDAIDILCTTPIKSQDENIQDSPRLYGTQKQTVILVTRAGRLKYIERTLYDDNARPVGADKRDVIWEFDIKGWN